MATWEVAQTISDVISADLHKRLERGRAGELGNATQGLTGVAGAEARHREPVAGHYVRVTAPRTAGLVRKLEWRLWETAGTTWEVVRPVDTR